MGSVAMADPVPKVLPIGSALPEFSLKGIDGKTHTAADHAKAKILCVIFTANHCPDAVAAATRMEDLCQDYKESGVELLAVSTNSPLVLRPDELGYSPYGDTLEEMVLFAKDHGWTFPYLYDGDRQEFGTACGAQSTPHAFVFDAERKLRYSGRIDDAGRKKGPVAKSQLRDVFDALLAGKEIAEPVTRSFGCSTKWAFKQADVVKDQKAWEAKPVSVADLDAALAAKLRSQGNQKARLIHFWSTTCGPCVREFPMLVDASRRFSGRPFDLISVSLDPADERVKVAAFLKKQHAAVPQPKALEGTGRTTNNFHWTGGNPDRLAEAIDPEWSGALPHTVIVAPDGKILWRNSGETDAVTLRKNILKAIDG